MNILKRFIFVMLLCHAAFAQPSIDWWRMYDFERHEQFNDAYRVADGGYIACGISTGDFPGMRNGTDIILVRMDNDGNLVWRGTYGGDGTNDKGTSVIETDNGTFMIAGECDGDVSVLHVNDEGEQIWYNTYGGTYATTIIELKSGEYWICGEARVDDENDGYIVAIDFEGEEIQANTYDYRRNDVFSSMRETGGGVMLCGRTSGEDDFNDIWAAKVSFDGELVLQNSYDLGDTETGCSIVAARNEGFLIGGWTGYLSVGQPYYNVFGLKINQQGREIWRRTFDIVRFDDCCYDIERMGDGGFILVGDANSHTRQLALRITPDGVERWHATYDFGEVDGFGNSETRFKDVIIGHDNSILAVGTVNYIEEGQNAYIMKLQYEDISPQFISWTPEDTVLSVLLGDTVDFAVQVGNAEDGQLEFEWLYNDSFVISEDVFATAIFDSLGLQKISCRVSDNGFVSIINWHVNVTECYISEHRPDTLELVVMRDESIDFSAGVRALDMIPYNFYWMHIYPEGERELGEDDNVSVIFDTSGEHWVECELNFPTGSDRVVWHISVIDFRITGWNPGETYLSVNRGSSLDFEVEVETVDNVEVSYLWTLSGPAGSEDIGEVSTVAAEFDRMGDYQLVCQVMYGEAASGVAWNIHAYSSIWSWYPEQLDLQVEKDTTLSFHVEATDPDSPTLRYFWLLDGEYVDNDDSIASDISIYFPEAGSYILSGILRDEGERDTVTWGIEIFDPEAVSGNPDLIPEAVSLCSPIPNPFNAEARINYALPSPDRVSLEVFDLHGRLVDVLFEGDKPAGYHTACLNASEMPAGLYFIRLATNNSAQIRKALVIK